MCGQLHPFAHAHAHARAFGVSEMSENGQPSTHAATRNVSTFTATGADYI